MVNFGNVVSRTNDDEYIVESDDGIAIVCLCPMSLYELSIGQRVGFDAKSVDGSHAIIVAGVEPIDVFPQRTPSG